LSQPLTQVITIPARSTQVFTFDTKHYPSLQVASPRLWWPIQMGSPNLYSVNITITPAGKTLPSDSLSTRFGIRQITDELTSSKHRLYRVNHQPILIRGGGYSPDLLLAQEIDTHRLSQIMDLTIVGSTHSLRQYIHAY
jgi:exo-1,4-beta-D-glucosaminidase